jgi:hypothetical protein
MSFFIHGFRGAHRPHETAADDDRGRVARSAGEKNRRDGLGSVAPGRRRGMGPLDGAAMPTI